MKVNVVNIFGLALYCAGVVGVTRVAFKQRDLERALRAANAQITELQEQCDLLEATLEAANSIINQIDSKAFRKLGKAKPVMPARRIKA